MFLTSFYVGKDDPSPEVQGAACVALGRLMDEGEKSVWNVKRENMFSWKLFHALRLCVTLWLCCPLGIVSLL